jgi:phosphatidylglycerophosphatase A
MNSIQKRSLNLLATWFGCGLSPRAPGTVGTLGAIPLLWLMQRLPEMQYLYATVGFTVFAIVVASVYELEIAKSHDQPEVVIDEVAGFLVTMAWLPFNWTYVILGFVLFRFFDALKPFPISYLDRHIEGGVGVVADDIAAGVICNIILQYLFNHHLWGLA